MSTWILAWGLLCAAGAPAAAPSAPRYTNDDLDRFAAERGAANTSEPPGSPEDGGAPEPAGGAGRRRRGSARAVPAPPAGPAEAPRGRGEAYWRREAERWERTRLRLQEQVDEVRERIAAYQPKKRTASLQEEPPLAALRRRLRTLEQRLADEEVRLADRARRDGALPGWLRN